MSTYRSLRSTLYLSNDTREIRRRRIMEPRLLEAAIRGNKQELLKLLGVDSHVLDRAMSEYTKKDNPLHLGALYGHIDFVREILSRKRDFTRELNSQGQSPLHLASERGHVEVVKEILRADPDACFVLNRHEMNPLQVAAVEGRVQVIEELVKANKATAFVLTDKGEPILHLCAKHNRFKALKKLVNLVDDDDFVKLKDWNDDTILHVLSAKSRTLEVPFLLKYTKVDDVINAQNRDGFNPMEAALVHGRGFRFGRLIVPFLLYYVWAKTKTEGRFKFPVLEGGTKLDSTERSWFNEVLIVVAILTITVAFQAGINPPGGVWEDSDKSYNGAPVIPGQSIMSYVDPRRYKDFVRFTNITVTSSMLVILMLLCRWDYNSISWITKLFPIVCTCISVCTMVASYKVSLSFLSSDDYDKYPRSEIYWIVFLLLLSIFVMAYIVEICSLSKLLIKSLKNQDQMAAGTTGV